MIAQTDRILVVNNELPVGAAIVRRLLGLGHPRSYILTPSTAELDGGDIASVRHYLQAKKLEQIYMWDPGFRHCGTSHGNGRRAYSGLIEAAVRAGVRNVIHVTTTSACSADASRHAEAPSGVSAEHGHGSGAEFARQHSMFLCKAIADAFTRGHEIDYRCVLTCDPYGPGGTPPRTSAQTHAGSTDRLIADLLQKFIAAKASGARRVAVAIDPSSRFDLMFVDDVADAVVFLMELPRAQFHARLPASTGHINLGTGEPVTARELVVAAAAAAGFTGSVEIYPVPGPPDAPFPDGKDIVGLLGWKPLLPLQSGLELKAMALQIARLVHRELQPA